jgi:biopolymer transport protein ExbD
MASSISGTGYEDEEPISDINVTPLVDVTLVLLIVFMITVPAIVGSAPVKVDLPESTAIAPAVEEPPLVFTLKRGQADNLELYLNADRIDEAGVRRTFESFGSAVAERDVALSAERNVAWEDVVVLIDFLKSLGVERLQLNTRHVEAR